MKAYLKSKLESCLRSLGIDETFVPTFEKPRIAEHGDLTTNVAMMLAKRAKVPLREFAQRIVQHLDIDTTLVDRVEVAGPGFINFHFTDKFYRTQLTEILHRGKDFGKEFL